MTDYLKYSFSFTAASLRLNEMVLAAKAIFEHSIMDYSKVTKRMLILIPLKLKHPKEVFVRFVTV